MDPSGSPQPPPGDTLNLDEIARAMQPRETLRQETVRIALSHGLAAWQRDLPRLALEPAPAAEQTASPGPDLEARGTLGEGGMGRVLLAWQRSLRREVAVKTSKTSAREDESRQMVLLEGRVTGSLEHPGIVPVHALGMNERDEPLLVMKRIDGSSWRELLRDPDHPILRLLPGGSDDPLEAHLFILAQVCNAVHFHRSKRAPASSNPRRAGLSSSTRWAIRRAPDDRARPRRRRRQPPRGRRAPRDRPAHAVREAEAPRHQVSRAAATRSLPAPVGSIYGWFGCD